MKKMKKQKTAECLAVLLHLFRKIILGWISCRGDEPRSVLCVLYKKEVTFHVIFCSVGWTQIIRWHQTHMRGCQLVAVHMLEKHKAWKELLTKEAFASLFTSGKMELHVLSPGCTHDGCNWWLSFCGQNVDQITKSAGLSDRIK